MKRVVKLKKTTKEGTGVGIVKKINLSAEIYSEIKGEVFGNKSDPDGENYGKYKIKEYVGISDLKSIEKIMDIIRNDIKVPIESKPSVIVGIFSRLASTRIK